MLTYAILRPFYIEIISVYNVSFVWWCPVYVTFANVPLPVSGDVFAMINGGSTN